MRRIVLGPIIAAALLCGCAKHDAAGSGQAATAPASVPSIFSRPHLKPGLWRTSLTTNIGPGISMTGELCLDASTDEAAFSSNGHGFSKDCDPVRYQAADGGFGFSTVCHLGKRTVTTSGVASGDFNSDYKVDLTTRTDPKPSGLPAQMSTVIRARWAGACPPGQKPGQSSMRISGFGAG